MRRFLRWVVNFAALASVLPGAATCLLWVRCYSCSDTVEWPSLLVMRFGLSGFAGHVWLLVLVALPPPADPVPIAAKA